MLVRYKKSCDKIAMGLLSLMPKQKDLKKLKHTKSLYETNENFQLYFWKQEDDYIGLIGIEIQRDHFIVRHLSVLPSYRGEGIASAMVEKINELMGERIMLGTKDTESFIRKYNKRSKQKV